MSGLSLVDATFAALSILFGCGGLTRVRTNSSAPTIAVTDSGTVLSRRILDLQHQPLAECRERGFELIHAGSVPQVEQAIDLGHVPAEAPRKLGLLDAGLAHGFVEREFRGREDGEGYHLLAAARTRGAQDPLAVADERNEGGLQRVGRAGQGVRLVVAKGVRD